MNVDKGDFSDHTEGSKMNAKDSGSKFEDSSLSEGMLGSPSANSTPAGVNPSSQLLDRFEQESEFSFIYNPLSPLKKPPLIKENERGDVKVISDALNEMYAFMQTSQLRIDSFAKYSQDKFARIDRSIASISNRVDQIETTCRDHNETLVFLGDDKVSKSELSEIKLDMERMQSRLKS